MQRGMLLIATGLLFVAGCADEAPPAAPAQQVKQAPLPMAAPPQPEPQVVRNKAEAGVGKAGQSLEPGGLITTPIWAKFRIEQRLVFDQVQHALDLFKAAEGRLPKSNDEFMQKIIKANNIKLPELPEGQRYVYDPQTGELMYEHPR